jgi:hypothetical protein
VNLSVRERNVLEAVSFSTSIGVNELSNYLEQTIPKDELVIVLDRLRLKGALTLHPGLRCRVVMISAAGTRALEENRPSV